MTIIKNLLLVDNDAGEYDTPLALARAIQRVKDVSWISTLCRQGEAEELLRQNRPHLVIIDNDFGLGVGTLAHAIERGIPAGYISAYNRESLKQQPEAMRAGTAIFEHPLVKLIQKRGRNISRNLTERDLEDGIYQLLNLYSK